MGVIVMRRVKLSVTLDSLKLYLPPQQQQNGATNIFINYVSEMRLSEPLTKLVKMNSNLVLLNLVSTNIASVPPPLDLD